MDEDGAALIAAERERQYTAEMWTAAHDDGHVDGELAIAASVYALPGRIRDDTVLGSPLWRIIWPWETSYWKPGNAPYSHPERTDPRQQRISELVKAGALIAAEIDRLARLDRDASDAGVTGEDPS